MAKKLSAKDDTNLSESTLPTADELTKMLLTEATSEDTEELMAMTPEHLTLLEKTAVELQDLKVWPFERVVYRGFDLKREHVALDKEIKSVESRIRMSVEKAFPGYSVKAVVGDKPSERGYVSQLLRLFNTRKNELEKNAASISSAAVEKQRQAGKAIDLTKYKSIIGRK